MDQILIEGARFQAHVGVSDDERSRRQEIIVDLRAFLDIREAGLRDDLSATVSYVDIHAVAGQVIAAKAYRLVETIAEQIATAVLDKFPALGGIVVRIAKPGAMANRDVRSAGVEIQRMRDE